jgi:hypothetical protein
MTTISIDLTRQTDNFLIGLANAASLQIDESSMDQGSIPESLHHADKAMYCACLDELESRDFKDWDLIVAPECYKGDMALRGTR